ncbi:MAG: Na+/H+ antiporter NhaA [Thermomicrobiales bacterium]
MITRFFKSEPASGILLILATVLALVVANSALFSSYDDLLHLHIAGLSVEHWVNDGLMAIFFLLVGLEIKREMIGGELSTWGSRILPGIAAAGGMALPAIVFLLVTRGEDGISEGWAIPTATDIAFALGILSLLGSRVPISLKVLLTSIAILDDLGAIVIIALFYTRGLSFSYLGAAAVCIVILVVFNRMGVTRLLPYLAVGAVLWLFVFRSGIHATLAGVVVALLIPAQSRIATVEPPLRRLEHAVDPWVSLLIVPVFAFANAGVHFGGLDRSDVLGPMPLGIALGLLLGKQIGIFSVIWSAVRIGIAPKPEGVKWIHIYGMALLCGIGFTMSLFIGGLAFSESEHLMGATRIGVLGGSLVSAVLSSTLLCRTLPARADAPSLEPSANAAVAKAQ